MGDLFDDFDDDFDGIKDDCGDDWIDEPDVENEPAESDGGLWDGPREKDWALIFPIAEEIAKEKQDQERTRKDFD